MGCWRARALVCLYHRGAPMGGWLRWRAEPIELQHIAQPAMNVPLPSNWPVELRRYGSVWKVCRAVQPGSRLVQCARQQQSACVRFCGCHGDALAHESARAGVGNCFVACEADGRCVEVDAQGRQSRMGLASLAVALAAAGPSADVGEVWLCHECRVSDNKAWRLATMPQILWTEGARKSSAHNVVPRLAHEQWGWRAT
jgi:hypothetical protein